jgi:hypothetical protein
MVKKKMERKNMKNNKNGIKRPLPYDGYWKPIK